jgi:isocitrate dehydrogenase
MRIALASGDGIGPEIMDATLDLLRAAGGLHGVDLVPVEMGKSVFDRGETRGMTDAAIATVEACGLLLKGPMETPKGGGGKSINVTARKIWNAFANLRHFRTLLRFQKLTQITKPLNGLPLQFRLNSRCNQLRILRL